MPRTKSSREANGRSTIYQDANGRWHGYVTVGRKADGSSDRRHREAATLTEVTEKVQALEKARDAGTVLKVDKRTTIAQWLRLWLDTIAPRNAQQHSVDKYRQNAERWIIPLLGSIRLSALSMEDIDAFHVRLLRREHLSLSLVRQVHQILCAALNAALTRDHLVRNVASLVKAPRSRPTEIEPLTRTQARALIKHASELRLSARWSVALALGLRQSEALGMRWRYLDLEAGILHVWKLRREAHRHGCADPHQCGQRRHRFTACPKGCQQHRKCPRPCVANCTGHAQHCPERIEGSWSFERPKSGKTRKVKIPPQLLTALKARRAAQRRERLAAGSLWEDWGLVFCQTNGRPIHRNADWKQWKLLCDLAQIPDVRVHDARHTAATLLIEQGIDVATVMSILGHATITTTQRYLHLTSELQERAANLMDDALFGP